MQGISQLLSRQNLKDALPYLAAVLIFVILSLVYASPVLEGRRLLQPDIVKWQGMSKEIVDHREATGEEALWTNSMFGGMPAFQISVIYAHNIANFFHGIMTLWLPRPVDMIFLYFAGFFIFLLLLRVNPWVAIAGALGFALSSYHFIILEAGHNSKAVAIGYMAPVLGAIIHTFRGHWRSGGLLFAIFMGLQLFANHFQITYYLGIIVAFYGLFSLYEHIVEKRSAQWFRSFGVLMAGLVLAIGINAGNFWSTWAYSAETMRGGSPLHEDSREGRGLSREYITQWSYGIGETFSLLIPNVKGGATGAIADNPKALQRIDPAFRQILSGENHYWGEQPFTSGPVYAGAVVLFLFFLGIFYVKGSLKWGLLLASALSIMLAWGKNFMPLTDFFINWIPAYDKFRAVSMTLVIAELAIPALAFLGLHAIYREPSLLHNGKPASEGSWLQRIDRFFSPLVIAGALTAGLSLLFYLMPGNFFSFISQMEASAYAGLAEDEPAMAVQINQFLQMLEQLRIGIFRADAMRSFLLASAALILVVLYMRHILKRNTFLVLLMLLIVIDMWPVNRRYMNDSHFQPRRRVENPYPLRQADSYILSDPQQFRVLDLTESTFNSARTSFYHHSIGGYHGAKLQRYQDLIDRELGLAIRLLDFGLRESSSLNQVQQRLENLPVLNMLNTRYIIYHPDAEPLSNPYALGNAWFVEEVQIVESAEEEIAALRDFQPRQTALIHREFEDKLQALTALNPAEGSIELTEYAPNRLLYRAQSSADQLAVFSEIWYPDGWMVSINGRPAEYIRANYVLRAMHIPAGTHEIEFRFAPRSYATGIRLSLLFSLVLASLLLVWAVWHIQKHLKAQSAKPDQKGVDTAGKNQ